MDGDLPIGHPERGPVPLLVCLNPLERRSSVDLAVLVDTSSVRLRCTSGRIPKITPAMDELWMLHVYRPFPEITRGWYTGSVYLSIAIFCWTGLPEGIEPGMYA